NDDVPKNRNELNNAKRFYVGVEEKLRKWGGEWEERLDELEVGLMEWKWSGEEKKMQEERRSELRKDKEKLEKAMNDWK
ncbi:3125_t:CDS:1, partial [Entrophospora sp. SA101]